VGQLRGRDDADASPRRRGTQDDAVGGGDELVEGRMENCAECGLDVLGLAEDVVIVDFHGEPVMSAGGDAGADVAEADET
jgi:hypothetical protein